MPQQFFIGQISVHGDCYCFGAALHHQIPVYLDIAGPATAVEAVWATLADGKEAKIVPLTQEKPIMLQPVEKGTLARIQKKLDSLSTHHMVLYHKNIEEPTYGDDSITYMILEDKNLASRMLGAHVQSLVTISVFPDWYNYLVKRGRETGLLNRCTCYGGIEIWSLALKQLDWESIIQGGLRRKAISLPGE